VGVSLDGEANGYLVGQIFYDCFMVGSSEPSELNRSFHNNNMRGSKKYSLLYKDAPGPWFIESCLDLASPTRGRNLAAINCRLSAGRTLPLLVGIAGKNNNTTKKKTWEIFQIIKCDPRCK
jgi:hypothetical protein